MAKDLPYFKFFCSEWNDGDITLEDFNIQGLFINTCSYYWSNECYLSIDKLKKRFRHNKEDIDYLFKINLLHNENGFLSIHFLDEQQEERKAKRVNKVKGGLASAEARRLKKEQKANRTLTESQQVLNSCSTESQLLREEKRREEEIREDIYTDEITEQYFLKRWKDARLHYDKKPTNITKLIPHERANLEDLKKDYSLKQFEQAIQGLFQQSTFPKTRLRPTHFLSRENFETYLTCFETKEILFSENKYKKPIERI